MAAEYISLFLYLIISLLIAGVMIALPFILVKKRNKSKYKAEPYECGSEPFESPRKLTKYKFYLIAVLFLVFEIEMCILFPWVIAYENLGVEGFIVMIIFFALLTLGFVYEWRKGVLDWD